MHHQRPFSSHTFGFAAWLEETFSEFNEQATSRDMDLPRSAGLFTLTFTNKKRQGRYGYRAYECEGTLYPSGHVHLDTMDLPVRDYLTFRQMRDYVSSFGECSITWLTTEGDQ